MSEFERRIEAADPGRTPNVLLVGAEDRLRLGCWMLYAHASVELTTEGAKELATALTDWVEIKALAAARAEDEVYLAQTPDGETVEAGGGSREEVKYADRAWLDRERSDPFGESQGLDRD